MDDHAKSEIERVVREVIAPLVEKDGGQVQVTRYEGDDVHIHLSGACAGCPGASMTTEGMIAPALSSVAPKARLVFTTGVKR